VDGLENLSPYIREHADTVNFLDINEASRSAVSYNGTVRALPLDTDYISIGWRQDVFHKHGLPLTPPQTIEELADLSERLNGLDHNDDGEPDWGVCVTPQVNYFYAFVAPVLQTQLHDTDRDGAPTGQNLFFDVETFQPLLRVPGFRYALKQYWRVIRSSNCPTQLANGEKCDRRTAFVTGRCAMVLSMPGTLTSMLLESGSNAPRDRLDESGNKTVWSIGDQPLGLSGGSYWGRRAPFPGSRMVQSWDRAKGRPLISCDVSGACPRAADDGINRAPFFAESGEAYALNGRQSKPSARNVMWDVFAWLSELPVTMLPLSGQYRKSHLNEQGREEFLKDSAWPKQMVDDLFALLGEYFASEDEGGNPAQDLLLLGYSEYMGALDEELHDKFLGVKLDAEGGLFDRKRPEMSIDPKKDADVFNQAYDRFVDALEERYKSISDSMGGGHLAQLQRWRQSLDLPWITNLELCTRVLSIDVEAFLRLGCDGVVDFENLCQTNFEAVANYDPILCSQYYGTRNQILILVCSVLSLLLVCTAVVACVFRRRRGDSAWIVKSHQLTVPDEPHVIGYGSFGVVTLAEYRGTKVAIKQMHTSKDLAADFSMGSGMSVGSGMSIRSGMSQGSGMFSTMGKDDVVSIADIEDRRGIIRTESRRSLEDKARRSSTRSTAPRFWSSHASKTDFFREMRLLAKLRHPCITTIMGAVIDGPETPKLVMEYMELGSLYDVLQNKTVALDGDLLLPILQEIAQGVRYLHASDPPIVHCDLKSKNILINAKFSAKVGDFGLSMNKSKRPKGTRLWMAPELLRGESRNTAASDVYAFGIILYEVYARKLPYEGEKLVRVLLDVQNPEINKRPPVPLGCPAKIGNLMKDCLLADPGSRPSFEEIDLMLQRLSIENVEPGEMHLSAYARKELKAKRANNLLFDVFPPHIAEALRDGRKLEPESHTLGRGIKIRFCCQR
jgi:serine/threonine protein kinase